MSENKITNADKQRLLDKFQDLELEIETLLKSDFDRDNFTILYTLQNELPQLKGLVLELEI